MSISFFTLYEFSEQCTSLPKWSFLPFGQHAVNLLTENRPDNLLDVSGKLEPNFTICAVGAGALHISSLKIGAMLCSGSAVI